MESWNGQKRESSADREQKDMEKVKGCLEGIIKNKKYKLHSLGQPWSWRYVNTAEPRVKWISRRGMLLKVFLLIWTCLPQRRDEEAMRHDCAVSGNHTTWGYSNKLLSAPLSIKVLLTSQTLKKHDPLLHFNSWENTARHNRLWWREKPRGMCTRQEAPVIRPKRWGNSRMHF